MTEIPDDVMKAAYDAVNAPTADEYGNSMRYYIGNNQSDMAVRVVASAILAERERCAKIAETMPPKGFPACYWMLENRAAAIRNNS